jgi:hypothetical protein
MFADDTACLAKNRNLNELVNYCNDELTKLARWFRANRMAVNVSKTKFIIFHTRGKYVDPNLRTLIFNDNEPNTNNPSLISEIERYHSHHIKPECRSYKLLGVNFDEYMSFDSHTTYLCNKLNRSLFCINRAKNYLTAKAMKTLYYSLIHSHLTYCSIIISCSNNNNLKKISMVQKKAIRIIDNKKYNDHTAPIFKKLEILPYDKLIKLAKLKFMHAVTYNYSPTSFTGVWATNDDRQLDITLRNNNQYSIPNPQIEQFKKSPLYSLPKEWNELNDIKLQQNKTTFIIALKELLISEI